VDLKEMRQTHVVDRSDGIRHSKWPNWLAGSWPRRRPHRNAHEKFTPAPEGGRSFAVLISQSPAEGLLLPFHH